MTGDPCEAWEPWPAPDVVQGQGIVSVILDDEDMSDMLPRSGPAGFVR